MREFGGLNHPCAVRSTLHDAVPSLTKEGNFICICSKPLWCIIFLLITILCAPLYSKSDYEDLLHTKALEWTVTDWINSSPLTLSELRGKVVLIKWWTGPYCPFCQATAPALKEWYKTYRDSGLVVIGFYHHKTNKPLTIDHVKQLAEEMEIGYPIAIDRDWQNLKKWWLDRVENARFTSITFLIDATGVIRYIFPGGKYLKGDENYSELQSEIEKQLKIAKTGN